MPVGSPRRSISSWPTGPILPTDEPADWSGVQALAVLFHNRSADPIDLVVRVDDEPRADGDKD